MYFYFYGVKRTVDRYSNTSAEHAILWRLIVTRVFCVFLFHLFVCSSVLSLCLLTAVRFDKSDSILTLGIRLVDLFSLIVSVEIEVEIVVEEHWLRSVCVCLASIPYGSRCQASGGSSLLSAIPTSALTKVKRYACPYVWALLLNISIKGFWWSVVQYICDGSHTIRNVPPF